MNVHHSWCFMLESTFSLYFVTVCMSVQYGWWYIAMDFVAKTAFCNIHINSVCIFLCRNPNSVFFPFRTMIEQKSEPFEWQNVRENVSMESKNVLWHGGFCQREKKCIIHWTLLVVKVIYWYFFLRFLCVYVEDIVRFFRLISIPVWRFQRHTHTFTFTSFRNHLF